MQHPIPFSDELLVERSLSGDQASYGQLVERYGERFQRYATSICSDADLASDCLQDAFIRAYGALPRCRDPQRFRSWFFRILTNTCHDACARPHPSVNVECLEIPAPERPEEVLEQRELAALIEQALEGLTPPQREAFVLRYVEGYTYEEIAELTHTTIDALKMRVHRARKVLQSTLQDEYAQPVGR
jgi:RNA polymerase sigma-70 factor (ECF subfamily)